MKKYLLVWLVCLSCVIASCDILGGGDHEIVIPKTPEFVQATTFPAVVEYNGNSVFQYEVLYTKYVEINGVKYNNYKGSVEFNKLTAPIAITIVAFGETSATNSVTVTINVKEFVPAPKISVTSPLESIPYGDKTTFSFSIEGVYTKITVDSVAQTSNTFTTEALYSSKEYTLSVVGPGGSVSTKISISVGDWKTSKLGLISYKPWRLKSIKIIQDGGVVWEDDLSIEQLTNLYYYPIGEKSTLYNASGTLLANSDWYFYEDNKIFASAYCTIVTLTESLFIKTNETDWYNKPAIREIVLYRP